MPHFRLRSLMVMVVIAALWLGWFVMAEERRLQEAVEEGNRLQWAANEWKQINESKIEYFKRYGNRRHGCE